MNYMPQILQPNEIVNFKPRVPHALFWIFWKVQLRHSYKLSFNRVWWTRHTTQNLAVGEINKDQPTQLHYNTDDLKPWDHFAQLL